MEEETAASLPPPLSKGKLSRFVKIILIADILFCLLLITRLTWILGNRIQRQDLEFFNLLDLEIGCIYFIAIIGNLMILCRKPYGIKLAYINVAGTAIDIIIYSVIVIGIWMPRVLDFNDEVYDNIGYLGILVDILIIPLRCVFLKLYWKAISQAKTFFAECEALQKTLSQ